ncbi:MAG: DNA mismatch repair endonuclease MutL, partial [Fusobacteriaceae bacterium]|nr:DNA mismatch repair endonuclease MutL [Fusobacteriaceae bacterium]
MGKIRILDESVSNIIAAGEVVENPASMIKELIENSLDAGATMIKIYVKSSGRYVKLIDNGSGMEKEDLFLSIERHATSKIKDKDDIFNLRTYGFRGEALASIASVSKLNLASRTENNQSGTVLTINAGKILEIKEIAMGIGTEIEVNNLFYNTPARLKFLRSEGTEYSKIKSVVLTEALANYDCGFTLNIDGKDLVKTSGKGIKNCIFELFGQNTLKNLKEFPLGYAGNLNILRSNRESIYTYINGRYVKSAIIEKAVIDSYYTKLMKGRYPFAIIFLEIDPKEIDVNVHPSKKIVKFSNETRIYSYVKQKMDEVLALEEREDLPVFVDFVEEKIANTEDVLEK